MHITVPAKLIADAITLLEADGLTAEAERLHETFPLLGLESVEVPATDLGIVVLGALHAAAKEAGARGVMMQISSIRSILASPDSTNVSGLKVLAAGLVAYIRQSAIDGWLYQKQEDGTFLPWLVRRVTYEPARAHSAAMVLLYLSACRAEAPGSSAFRNARTTSYSFEADDLARRTIPEILAQAGFYHETPELRAMYDADLALFLEYREKPGAQFVCEGPAYPIEGPNRRSVRDVGKNSRLVSDEQAIDRVQADFVDGSFWEASGSQIFDRQPYHCRLFMFHLGLHEHFWVHAALLKPYEYKVDLRNKLVLPALHHDLIDILTTDMDVIMNDIVEGKSGGTTILCKGAPGLGKTLTAEVYSEVIQRPLYRVHSGQLGTEAVQVESTLGTVMTRAAKWGAVLLIDEADVFVRKRGDDLQHNAVVAAFLRTLEYFTGLLFMTTNRIDEIDDAILSRCVAVIQFQTPTSADAALIWRVLSEQFELEMSEALIHELVGLFPRVSGRDIKELLKLTSKYARRRGRPLTADLFRQCAMFRGLL